MNKLKTFLKAASLLTIPLLPASAFSQTPFSNYELCKAAISSEMGKEVNAISTLKSPINNPEITYTRKQDGTNFRYSCKFEGRRIIWRTYFNDSVKVGWGRWRNEEGDASITYTINGNNLVLNNSSVGTQTFTKQDF